MPYESEFDGISACASLVHVADAELDAVFSRFAHALRPEGVWYMSFKLGRGEEVRDGRFFRHFAEEELRRRTERQPNLTVAEVWVTPDQRPRRRGERWVNALACRF
jgi:hypothetical protein